MQVNGLNHVNIIAEDLAATAEFYERVLGMRVQESAGAAMGFSGRWICDAGGRAIIHVQAHNPERHGPLRDRAGGAVDHVALSCTDFDGTLQRCSALGIPHRVNDRKYGDLRQIFVTDPDQVVLELNFAGE